jgi:CHAT domain-containing protein
MLGSGLGDHHYRCLEWINDHRDTFEDLWERLLYCEVYAATVGAVISVKGPVYQLEISSDRQRRLVFGRTRLDITPSARPDPVIKEISEQSIRELSNGDGTPSSQRLNHIAPAQILNWLENSARGFLIIATTPDLLSIPWELVNVSDTKLADRFAVGRQYLNIGDESQPGITSNSLVRKAVMVFASQAPDRLPLTGVEDESRLLAEMIPNLLGAEFVATSNSASRDDALGLSEVHIDAEILHFAGHVSDVSNSHMPLLWLSDGAITLTELLDGMGKLRLIVLNACHGASSMRVQSGTAIETWLSGVAATASRYGIAIVCHRISPTDSQALQFAQRFYQNLLTGCPVGESLRLTSEGWHSTDTPWLGSMVVGDPRTRVRTDHVLKVQRN